MYLVCFLLFGVVVYEFVEGVDKGCIVIDFSICKWG